MVTRQPAPKASGQGWLEELPVQSESIGRYRRAPQEQMTVPEKAAWVRHPASAVPARKQEVQR